MASDADGQVARTPSRSFKWRRWIVSIALLLLVIVVATMLILRNQSQLLHRSLKADIVAAKGVVSSSQLCLLVGSTPADTPPTNAELDRCFFSTAKEAKASILTGYAWYINTDPQAWVSLAPAPGTWVIAICDPVSRDPYFLIGRGGSAKVGKDIEKAVAQKLMAEFKLLGR